MLKLAQAIRLMRECRRGLTVRELAGELECSIKTARRILELIDIAIGISSCQEFRGTKRWRLKC
jgi:predicted DNA-binding transcriptional regulator YafY